MEAEPTEKHRRFDALDRAGGSSDFSAMIEFHHVGLLRVVTRGPEHITPRIP